MRPTDHIIVMHVYDDSKAYLAPELRSDYIYRTTESQLLPYISPSNYTLSWIQHDHSKSTRQELVETAEALNTTIMVVGFVGRKGPKDDVTVMGSAVDHSLQIGHFHLLILKYPTYRSRVPEGRFNWIVLVDGSQKSEQAFRTAAALARRDLDDVYVIHGRVGESEGYKSQYDGLIAHYGLRGSYFDLNIRRSTFTEQLIEFLNTWEVRVDFTVLGANGTSAFSSGSFGRVGSVATDIIKQVKSNILIVK